MRKLIAAAALTLCLAFPTKAHAVCTDLSTGLQLPISALGDGFSVWADCIRDMINKVNDGAASTTTVASSTGALQVEVDALSLSTSALAVSTGSLELSKVNRAGDTMTGDLNIEQGKITASTFTASTDAGILFEDNAGTDAMFIEDGGNVGIGTTDPAAALEVVGPIQTDLLTFDSLGAALGSNGWIFTMDTNTGMFRDTTDSFNFVAGGINPVIRISDRTTAGNSSQVRMGTLGGNQTDLLVTGNVGVGTTAPAEKFHMSSGTLLVDGTDAELIVFEDVGAPAGGTGATIIIKTDGSDNFATSHLILDSSVNNLNAGSMIEFKNEGVAEHEIDSVFNGPLRFTNFNFSAVDIMALHANGRTSIGRAHATPLATLDVRAPIEDEFTVQISSQNNTAMAVFKADGRMGIGTSSPAAKIHMSSGTLLIDGDTAALIVGGPTTLNGPLTSTGPVRFENGGSVIVTENLNADDLTVDCPSGNCGIQIGVPAAGTGRIAFNLPGDSEAAKIQFSNSQGLEVFTQSATDLKLGVNGNEAIKIDESFGVVVNTFPLRLPIKTIAELQLITPSFGDMYGCSNCLNFVRVVFGTGTLAGFDSLVSGIAWQ